MDAEDLSFSSEDIDAQSESLGEDESKRRNLTPGRRHRRVRSLHNEPAAQHRRGSLTGFIGFLAVVWLIRASNRRRRGRRRRERGGGTELSAGQVVEDPSCTSSAEGMVSDVVLTDSREASDSRSKNESNSARHEPPSWRSYAPSRSTNFPVDPSPGSLNEEAHVSNPLITEAEAGGSVDARSRLGGSGVSRHAAEEDERQHAAMTSSAGEMDDDSGGGSRLWSMIESERRSASLLERTSTGTGRGAEYAEQLARELDEMRTAQSKDRFDSAPESNRLSASVLSSSEWLEPSTAGAFSGLNAALEASREAVIVTDESNEPVRVISRAEMRRENLWHRATYILVLTPERDRIYIQKRTMTKDIHPGMYDAAAGGVVKAGETYDESAKRELFEELGLDLPLEPVGPIRYETDVTRVFGQVFVAIFDPFQEPRQRIRPQVEEVESVELVPIGEVLSQSEGRTFTEDTLLALRKFLETQSTEAASSSFVFSSKESGGGEQREQRSTTLHDNPKDTPQAESILENRSSTPGLTDESASASLASSPNVVATPMVVPPPAQTLVENPSPPPIESFFDDVDPASVEARALLQSLRPTP